MVKYIKKAAFQLFWYCKYYLHLMLFAASRLLPDDKYLKIHYKQCMKKKLNLDNPVTYNEKLNWLKLNDRKEQYTKMADKYEVREYVRNKIGDDYLIPLLGVWDRAEDINFSNLPSSFVLKCTHDSGSVIVCRDKEELDIKTAIKFLSQKMRINYFWYNREWVYKNITPRVVAEEYIVDKSDGELRDYKIFCFNGVPKTMYVATGRMEGKLTFDYYDMEFNRLDIVQHYPNANMELHKPEHFELMKELAGKLAEGIVNVRVDFYEANGKVYFGEMTFYNNGGTTPYEPEEWDYIFGSWLDIGLGNEIRNYTME